MSTEDLADGAVRSISQEKYDFVDWSEEETLFRTRRELRNTPLSEIEVPFAASLRVKLRRSVLGTYLKFFNEQQRQDEFLNENKLGIMDWILKNYDEPHLQKFDYNNNMLDETVAFLKKASKMREVIDVDYMHKYLDRLRLDVYNVNTLDKSVSQFRHLQDLILCGNWLTDVDGAVLPRGLKFLELFCNDLTHVKNLAHKPPKQLQHLGLSRNKLNDDSSLHLLGKRNKFKQLKSLDLSDNDIYHLLPAAQSLKTVESLEALALTGNPCSVVRDYVEVVLQNIPDLIFLDGTEITTDDRKRCLNGKEWTTKGLQNAEFIFSCSKVTGLPPPPKDKSVKQTIHVEFNVPLFQKLELLTRHGEVIADDVTNQQKKGASGKSSKASTKKSKKSSNKSSKKSSKKSSPYEEHSDPNTINCYFATSRKAWGKSMSFPAITMKSPEDNLNTLRDTFRCRVDARVIYLKVALPVKKKKEKKPKGKKKTRADKKSKKDKKSDKSKAKKEDKEPTADKEDTKKQEPKEVVLKRVTLGRFQCELFSPCGKDRFAEFHWCPEVGTKGLTFENYMDALTIKQEPARNKSQEIKGKQKNKKDKGKAGKGKKAKANPKTKKEDKKSKSSKKSKKPKTAKFIKPQGIQCKIKFGFADNDTK